MPNTADTLPRPINTPDSFAVLSPTGMVFYPNWPVSGVNGDNADAGHVSIHVPGQILAAFRKGEFQVFHPGVQGIIELDIITGSAGSQRMLLALESDAGLGTSIVIFLDASNRPGVIITVGGAIVEDWTPSGAAISTGVPLQLKLLWNSRIANADLQAVGAALAGAWSGVYPSWNPAPMTKVLAGWAPGYSDFNGTITQMLVGTSLGSYATYGTQGSVIKQAAVPMAGSSAMTDTATMMYAATSSMVGGSAMTASVIDKRVVTSSMAGSSAMTDTAVMGYAATSLVAGDSTIAATATVKYAVTSPMDGDSTVGADATV